MGFALKPFCLMAGIVAAALFWWRPAPELISLAPVNWALEYEAQHTPVQNLWGAMEMAKEMIRRDSPHQALTEYIDRKTKNNMQSVQGPVWVSWYRSVFGQDPAFAHERAYASPGKPPANTLTDAQGYLALHHDNAVYFLRYHRLGAKDLGREDIPYTLRYPFRWMAMAIFGVTLLFWIATFIRKPEKDLAADSSAGTGMRVFMAGLAMGLGLLILPFLYYGGEGGYPALFLGVFITMVGFVGLAFFGYQLAFVRKMISGRDCLAHWTYSPDQWSRFLQWELKEEKAAKKGLFIYISVIIMAVGLGFWAIMRDEASFWVLLFLVGLVFFLWAVALLSSYMAHRRLSNGPGEVYVGSSGIYLNGAVHTWSLIGSRFESVVLLNEPFSILVFVYSYLMAAGRSLFLFRQYAEVRIPVPEGHETEALKIVAHFKKKKQK